MSIWPTPYSRPLASEGFRSRIAGHLFTMMQSNRDWLMHLVRPVPDEWLWLRPVPHKNSIGNLLWHIGQSEKQWIHDRVGGRPFQRDREGEFSPTLRKSRRELVDALVEIRTVSGEILRSLTDEDLNRLVDRPGYRYTVERAIHHNIQHEAYHVGQVLILREALKAGIGRG